MTSVPLVQATKAMDLLIKNREPYRFYGTYHEHKLTHDTWFKSNGHLIRSVSYSHYNTTVIEVQCDVYENKTIVVLGSYGYSKSDVDNANTLLVWCNIDSIRVYRVKNELYLKIDGEKTTLKSASIRGVCNDL